MRTLRLQSSLAPALFMVALWAVLSGALYAERVESQLFRGVMHRHVTEEEPLRWSYHVVLIDLSDPAIRFTATPANGDAPKETNPQKTRVFVKETGAQLGINANYFILDKQPHTTLLGLAVTEGELVSPWENNRYSWALNISKENEACVIQRAENVKAGQDTQPAIPLYTVISGNARLLEAGKNLMPTEGPRHPRTGIGVTADKQLMLCVVDGRQEHHSIGMTLHELAEVMREHGAVDAIALDGGGSSTLVIAKPTPKVVNVPMPFELNTKPCLGPPGIERKNGNNLAVFAAPID